MAKLQHARTGAKPSAVLGGAIAALVPLREANETIVVHHFTDSATVLQLEIERRSATLGLAFERHVIDAAVTAPGQASPAGAAPLGGR